MSRARAALKRLIYQAEGITLTLPGYKAWEEDAHPRDEGGRFTSGGGGDGETAGNEAHPEGAPSASASAPRPFTPHTFTSGAKYGSEEYRKERNQLAYDQSHDAYKGATKWQKEAVEKYKGSGYTEMNRHLRAEETDIYHHNSELDKECRRLAKLIEESPTSVDLTLYRGVPNKVLPQGNAEGAIIEDRAFNSTALSAEFASTWAGSAVLEIKAPAGTYALGISGMTSGSTPRYDSEYEMVLQHGTQYRVISDNWGTPSATSANGWEPRRLVVEIVNQKSVERKK